MDKHLRERERERCTLGCVQMVDTWNTKPWQVGNKGNRGSKNNVGLQARDVYTWFVHAYACYSQKP